MRARTHALVITALALTACLEGQNEGLDLRGMAPLEPAGSCTSALAAIKGNLIGEMEDEVNANMQRVLDGDYCYRDEDPWGRDYDGDYGGYMDAATDASAPTGAPEESGEEAEEYSETNNQVAGVDEADFIKNDGGHIYILADGKLKILDSWPAPETRIVSSTPIEGEPRKLFVSEGRAVVYSAPSTEWDGHNPYYRSGECTYGYDCDFTGDGRPTKITVLDITDLENPTLLRETWFSGSYINSRRVGPAVHTVINFQEMRLPSLATMPEDLHSWCPVLGIDRSLVKIAFKALIERNRDIIESIEVTDWIPSVKDTVHSSSGPRTAVGLLDTCEGFYVSGLGDGRSMMSIASLDMQAQDPVNLTTIVGRPGAVYASAESLYVATRHTGGHGSGWYLDEVDSIGEATIVHRFELDNDGARSTYASTGVVKGRVLNQFSMDEKDGYLRIATTTGRAYGSSTHSTVSVMAEQGDAIGVVGQVDGIAPTEDIRSVRFDGDRGYVVTFKKTDPLFVLDLSDPQGPRITGELKIPGYSTYMHMMDDSHVLSIGYDAEDMGSFAWFQGIQLQVLDVSDLENPALLHKEVIGTRGSTSDAATDHLAFNFFASRDLLAIPMIICEDSSGGGSYGTEMTFSGLLVYRVTTDAGFTFLGGVDHRDPDSPLDDSYSCHNWWTDSNSQVKRSIFMEDYVFSVATDLIKVNHIDALGTDLAVIDLLD
jgi:hypothetical protein